MKLNSYLRQIAQTEDLDLQELRKLCSYLLDLDLTRQLKMDLVELNDSNLAALNIAVEKLKAGQRVERIVSTAFFYGHEFHLNEACLIPRPDSEVLITEARHILEEYYPEKVSVLDICAGSGCLGLALLAAYEGRAELGFIDVSAAALSMARLNQEALLPGLITRDWQLDLLQVDSLVVAEILEEHDIVLFNPPYLTTAEYEESTEEFKRNDPAEALVADNDGLGFYQRISEIFSLAAKFSGFLVLEHGSLQGEAIYDLFSKAYGSRIELRLLEDYGKKRRGLAIHFLPNH
ncbi:MAG: HemK/PrmC family methyltransferase [Eubacteriales bacterium]|nr:HemK/PrmC family methyltransferase [Eubacteriales bacterium]